MKSKRRIVIIAVCIAVALAAVIGTGVILRQRQLDRAQNEFVAELISAAGTYDESTIVLQNTTKYEAEALAEQLNAKLRITSNGRFATLSLPEGVTILDVCSDRANKNLISAVSPDYNVYISEVLGNGNNGNDGNNGNNGEHPKHPKHPLSAKYNVTEKLYNRQIYLDYINIGKAWDYLRGTGKTVAVIDTGIDTDHPEFEGRISEWSYNASEGKIVKDFVDDNGNYQWSLIEDEQGHGTSVTGVIAAAMDGEGITGIVPEVTILVIKAECDSSGKFMSTSHLVFGIYYAIERDADVINMSFGSSSNAFADALQLAYDSDILCVAAAGNDGSPDLCYPAADKNVIGVGAFAENSWEIASYSNYGDNVDVFAPGTVYTTAMGGGYRYVSGTSLASPIVASAMVMYKNYAGNYTTNDKFVERLHASCCDLGTLGPDYYYGYGALDINALFYEGSGTVTFEMLTDEVENESVLFIPNHPVQDIPEPERIGSVFDGWYYDPQFTEELNWYEDVYNSAVTLYAKWANEDDAIPFGYRVLDDGTVEITGYRGRRKFITIPNYIEGRQVSSIGDGAFTGDEKLRRVILPRYLTNIGANAFSGCSNIVTIDIISSVTNIGEYAFADCVRLETLNLGNAVQTIGKFAFTGCGKLTSIYLPATVKSVDGSAFFGTTSMKQILTDRKNKNFVSVEGILYNHSKSMLVAYPAALTSRFVLPSQTKYIGEYAFGYSASTNVEFPHVQYIYESAFMYSRLMSANIPDSCIFIGASAFSNCTMLQSVSLGNSIKNINEAVFNNTASLKTVTIPRKIGVIGAAAFSGSGLQTVNFESNSALYKIDDGAFAFTDLVTVSLPDSVLTIRDGAFKNCTMLESVEFGNNSAMRSIGKYAFAGTRSLSSISLPDTIQTIDEFCFSGSGLTGTVSVPASVLLIGNGAFASCHSLTAIDIDESNRNYADIDGVVYDKEFKTLKIYPAGNTATAYTPVSTTEKIGVNAFHGSWNLNKVTMPTGLTEICGYAFYDCREANTYSLNSNLELIGEYAFSRNTLLTSIRIPDKTRQIGRCCFAEDNNLTSIYINDSSTMTRIDMRAFAFCGLTSFRVPANVSSVAQYAFEGCTSLESVTFASNSKLESISAYFFNGCSSIKTITFEQGSALKSIQAHGLQGMTSLRTVNFNNAALEEIDNYAFMNCPALNQLSLPSTLKNIGRFAFFKCEAIRSLTVPDTLEHIGEYAFFATKSLNLYFISELLPIYLDENWDNGLDGYYTGVLQERTNGDWKYAELRNDTVAVLKYLGNDTTIDLNNFPCSSHPVSVIGGYAFADKNIETIYLPDTLEQIQRYAFLNTDLTSVVIPADVTYIAQHAFDHSKIESVTFSGNKVKVIEQYAFAYTKQLESVTVPGSLEKLGSYVFFSSNISSVTFGDGFNLDTIPEGAFAETNLVTVTIPDCVTRLDHNAFSHNHSLKSVDLGDDSDLMIMSNVFYNTGLESVYIGANVQFVGEYSFTDLDSLTAFTVDADNPYYTAVDGVLYNKDCTKLISMPAGRTGSFTIPNTVEVLGFGAFENSQLSEINVAPETQLVTFGCRAFYHAQNLTSFTVPASVVSIDYYAFAECDHLQTVVFEDGNKLSGIYEGAFFGCRALENIMLPDTVSEVADYAFYGCETLDTFPFSENTGVLGIYDYAFAYTQIAEIYLPADMYDVGEYAFLGAQIKDIIFNPSDPERLAVGFGAFAECNEVENLQIPYVYGNYLGYIFGASDAGFQKDCVPQTLKNVTVTYQTVYDTTYGTVKNIYNGTYSTAIFGCFESLNSLEVVTLPDDTLQLSDNMFKDCSALMRFDMPAKVKEAPKNAFYNCSMLERIDLTNLKKVGVEAFYKCIALKIDEFPDTLTIFGSGAFNSCSSLENAVLSSEADVSNDVFKNCTSLKTARIGGDTIRESLFSGCSSLETVTIGDNVTSVLNGAFSSCTKLKRVIGNSNITYIGGSAFSGCVALRELNLGELTNAGGNAFNKCNNLNIELYFADNVTDIGWYSFRESGFTKIVIPGTVENFSHNSFEYAKHLEWLEFGSGVTVIPYESFRGISTLKTLILPSTLERIEHDAFNGCSNLTGVVIPNTVTKILDNAFANCSRITSVTVPASVTEIGVNAFSGCKILTIVNNSALPITIGGTDYGKIAENTLVLTDSNGRHRIDEDTGLTFETNDGFLFRQVDSANDSYKLIAYIGSEKEITLPGENYGHLYPYSVEINAPGVTAITVPEGITDLKVANNPDLRSITLPSTVTNFPEDNFKNCSFSQITVSEQNTALKCENGVLSKNNKAYYFTTSACPDVVIPEGITGLESFSFSERKDIVSITFPSTFGVLDGRNLFKGCKIERLIFSDSSSVQLKGAYFSGISNLKELYLGGCTIIDQSFQSNKLEELIIPDTVTSIGGSSFKNSGRLTNLVIGTGVKTIYQSAFENCDLLPEVVIPANVTQLGNYVFKNSDSLADLTIGSGLTKIPTGAFEDCDKLDNVTIPANIIEIGETSFKSCDSLTGLVISQGVQRIKTNAFADCPNLKYVYIPASVTEIGGSAFNTVETIELDSGNTSFVLDNGILYNANMSKIIWISPAIKNVIIPDNVTSIYTSMFENCSWIETVSVPSGITEIGSNAFKGCTSLTTVTLPDGLLKINSGAFTGCTSLNSINIPGSIKEISTGAFQTCSSLTSITLPEGLEIIGSDAFTGTALNTLYIPASVNKMEIPCDAEKHVQVAADSQYYGASGGILYGKAAALSNAGTAMLLTADAGKDLVVPEGVVTLPFRFLQYYQFDSVSLPESLVTLNTKVGVSTNCKTLYIPKNVKTITSGYIYQNQYDVFDGEEYVVDPENQYFCSIDGVLFNKDASKAYVIPKRNKSILHVPEGRTEILEGEFSSAGFTGIILPSTLQVINANAFSSNRNVNTITIPASVTEIKDNAFEGASSLRIIYNNSDLVLTPGTNDYGKIALNAFIVYNKGVLTLPVTTDDGWSYMEENGFICKYKDNTYKIIAYLGSESSIVIPSEIDGHAASPDHLITFNPVSIRIADGVTSIPDYAFQNNKTIISVEMPDSVTSLGYEAFGECSALKSAVISGGIYSINRRTFYNCDSLETVVIREGVIEVGYYSFYSCENLVNVSLPTTLKRLSQNAFQGCSLANGIVLPSGLESINECIFSGTKLPSITIPDNVAYVGTSAFAGCSRLAAISLPEKYIEIGAGAFSGTAYALDESNWENDQLYCGRHLLKCRSQEQCVVITGELYSACLDAFYGCDNLMCLEISGDAPGALQKQYLPSLEILMVRNAPAQQIYKYFEYNRKMSVPESLKAVILKEPCKISHNNEFKSMSNIAIYLEAEKEDAPFDRILQGWNNSNNVSYGGKWYLARFYDTDNRLITMECFKTSQVIRPPYVVLPKSGDTAYTHVGWDIDGDGEPDGLPASRLSNISAHAVVTTSQPAVYTVKFIDMDRITVLHQYTLEYGQTITLPADPVKTGYTFTGWENYTEGDTVNENTRIYSTWKHIGDGHVYTVTTVAPTCTEKGYKLHKCTICGEEYRTDYVSELWHRFGDWVTDTPAGCTTDGEKHRDCTVCGFRETAVIDATGHNFVGTVEKHHDCTHYGIMSYVCSVCGETTSESIDMKPHSYQAIETDYDFIIWLDILHPGFAYGQRRNLYWYYCCTDCGKLQMMGSAGTASVGDSHDHEYSLIKNSAGQIVGAECTLCGEKEYLDTASFSLAAFSRTDTSSASVANISLDPVQDEYAVGTTVTLTAEDKSASGYTFLGWYEVTETEGGLAAEYGDRVSTLLQYTFDIYDDVSVTAVYKANSKAKITIECINQASYRIGDSSTIRYGGTTYAQLSSTLVLHAADPGSVLQWQNGSDKLLGTGGDLIITVTGEMTIKLVYKTAISGQSFVQFVSSTGQVLSYNQYSEEDDIDYPPVPSKFGYDFRYWVIDGENEPATESHLRSCLGDMPVITLKPVYEANGSEFVTTTHYINASGTKIKENYEYECASGEYITVNAPETIGSNIFECWKNADGLVLSYKHDYYMQSSRNSDIYACYQPEGTEINRTPVIAYTEIVPQNSGGTYRISVVSTRSTPEGYELLELGTLYGQNLGNLTEETFVGGASGVSKFTSTSTNVDGVLRMNKKVSSVNDEWYFRGYMILKNLATGNSEYYYTSILKASYLSLTE